MNINATTYNNYSSNAYLGANSISPDPNQNSVKKPGDFLGNPLAASDPSVTPDPKNTDTEKDPRETSKSGQQAAASELEKNLTQEELQLVTELKQRDTEVRNHEMAHLTAGGSLITSGASFTYERGPDGNKYAVAGEVGIDTSAIPGDPRATVQKMQQVKRAAMAPASPSSQDLKVASQASSMAAQASSELTMLMAEQQAAANESKAFGNKNLASDAYTKVNNLPEEDTHTFNLAV